MTTCCSLKCEKRYDCAKHCFNNAGIYPSQDYSTFGSGTVTPDVHTVTYWCGELGGYKMFEPVLIKRDGWIPCSEGLPECHLMRDVFKRPQCYMSDSVIVTVKSDECDGIHYFVGTDYMSGKNKEDAHWMMSCGYSGSAVYNQEIIAWMYKPDPYKEQ